MATDDPLALSLNLYEKGGWWYPKRYVDNKFEDRGEVVVAHATGLMWQKSGSKHYMNYEEVEQYVKELNQQKFAGYSDWRLPTIPELMSLLEPEKQSNELYTNPIFDAKQHWCWSADIRRIKDEDFFGVAWGVHFRIGVVHWDPYEGYVRVVRSLQ